MSKESDSPVGDFIRDGMDKLIDEEFNNDKTDVDENKDTETEEEESEKDTEEEGNESDDNEDAEEDTEDEEEIDKEGDKDEEEDTEQPAKEKSPIAAARADKEFRELLKKHPDVEKNYFLGKEYGKMFESVDDAQKLLDTKEYIDNVLEDAVGKGDPESLLKTLYEAADDKKEGFFRFALSLLPTINELAPALAQKMIEAPIINLFAQLGKAAEESGDDDLATAVKLCMKAMYGKEVIPKGVRISKFVKDTSDIDKEKENLLKTAEGDFFNAVEGFMEPVIEAEIKRHMDDDLYVSDGVREMIIGQVLKETFTRLRKDDKHMTQMSRLKKAARANRFSDEYKRKVIRESIEAAKPLIPKVVREIERKVFGGVKVNKDDSTDGLKRKKSAGGLGNTNGNKSATGTRGEDNSKDFDVENIDFRKTSLRDALDFDPKKVTFKKKH